MCTVRVVYMMRVCEGEGVRHVYSEGGVYDEDV